MMNPENKKNHFSLFRKEYFLFLAISLVIVSIFTFLFSHQRVSCVHAGEVGCIEPPVKTPGFIDKQYEVVGPKDENEKTLTTKTNSFCFLSYTEFEDVQEGDEWARCSVAKDGNAWKVKAATGGDGDTLARCAAMCIFWE